MTATILTPGQVDGILKRIEGAPDPTLLFRRLAKDGSAPNTLLLESADIVTRKGERSILAIQSALKIVCRGFIVEVTALNSNGTCAFSMLRQKLSAYMINATDETLTFSFDACPKDQSLAAKLRWPSPLNVLRTLSSGFEIMDHKLARAFFTCGVFSYDLIDCFEELPEAKTDRFAFPNYVFWLPDVVMVIDHRKKVTSLIAHVFGGQAHEKRKEEAKKTIEKLEQIAQEDLTRVSPGLTGEVDISARLTVDTSDADYEKQVAELKTRIVAGDVFQIVPSRTFSLPCSDPLDAYERLKQLNPSPYMYYIRDDDFTLLGASPETFIKVSGSPKVVEVRPIAGTRRRGLDENGQVDLDLDARREAELRLDRKEVAEHMMLVDLARNDVARVSKPKTRYVEKLMNVDRYSHVMHLTSYVRGELRDDLDALHAYQASMNMGTLVGAPKVKASEILRLTENTKRGTYGGAVGYINNAGEMDTAITIRSAFVKDGVAHVRAGAGVVYDSIAEEEAKETRNKAEAVLAAIGKSL